ncbi:MAG TPA: MBL fold metallo-hydrolase [Planctomycetota bacterium]|nr:MBL fold metallo-hydrolase [Planctomycetota bacterium]
MLLKQIYLGCLSQASYLLGDEESGTAAVVDPRRDVETYLEEAKKLGLTIRHVVLTHFHADFVSGHLELQEKTGAPIYLGAKAKADYAFTPLHEGDAIAFGKVRIDVLETPGHTPEGISLVVYDLARDAKTPHAVLTGDALFVGDVGRPDLLASIGVTADELAGLLYESLHGKLLRLPDETIVYPAHGPGSMCGKSLGPETSSTIGAQRRANAALRPMTKEQFVRFVTSEQPDAPAYFAHDADQNRRKRSTLERNLAALKALPLDDVLARQRGGAQVLDVRDPAAFAKGHLAGSVNVGIAGRFASWAGSVLDAKKAIVVVAPAGKEREAAMRLGRVGLDGVVGWLEGGFDALASRPDLVRRIERVTADQLSAELHSSSPPVVLDVRAQGERDQRRIEGSIHVPLTQLRARAGEVPRGKRVVVHCAGGYRSMIAASLLEPLGVAPLADLEGGIDAWK